MLTEAEGLGRVLHSGDLLHHRQILERLRKGRYGGTAIMDYLENKATKAVYITQQHVIYVSLDRHAVRWALSLCHLFSVTTAGAATPAVLSAHGCRTKGRERVIPGLCSGKCCFW